VAQYTRNARHDLAVSTAEVRQLNEVWAEVAKASPAQDAAAEAYSLPRLAEQFLTHLAAVRRCSPLTVAAYRSDYRKITRLLTELDRGLDVRVIRTGDLQLCLAQLSHLSGASVERLIHALSSLFKFLAKQGLVEGNPVDDVDRPQRQRSLPRDLSRGDFQKLMGACDTTLERAVVGLLGGCGLRRAELLALNVIDVSADLSALRVEGKGRKQRAVPVHHVLRPVLGAYIASLAPGEAALIRNQVGKRMSATTLWRLFGRLVRRAGLQAKGLTVHCLRHHFASQLIQQGTDIATVAELLGHSNISTTSIYLHSNPDLKQEAVSRLALSFGLPEAGTVQTVPAPSGAAPIADSVG
jgi:integrase/recombinase XerD